ncbi:MAG: indolepyruvate ferredoxin oxidoreductase subunit alpha [Lachnospiraceae bacterium]|nr:indolepyruvate ferredoxin oxidoreductase subunit alpha [Lachnospiraceae bacterium]
MHKEFLMGNEAIALGALAAGVNVVCGYPGTPSSEVLETVAARRTPATYVEWSVNEKAALEMAAGVAYSGGRALVTMKQVGLNVASDPLMSLEYVGVKGGLVVLSADDPGPISSQTEQDTRTFARFSKVPCFDPSSAAEAYQMIQEAFELSEKYGTPVFLRPTTRVCHGYASIDVKDVNEYHVNTPSGFEKDSSRWVIFPRLSFANHAKIEARNEKLQDEFSDNALNSILEINGSSRIGFAAGGISFAYALEELTSICTTDDRTVRDLADQFGGFGLLKVGTPFPFPEKLALSFLEGLDAVLVFEELDPVIERELTYICGKYGLKTRICGKLSHHTAPSGENTRDSVREAACKFIKEFSADSANIPAEPTTSAVSQGTETSPSDTVQAPKLPVRPPVLCAGCPHRASFYAVKKAMKGKKAFFGGDIGCYTLGNAAPLDMVDTCLCMGAGVNIAQGIGCIDPETVCFAFVGDSTFFASAITGVVNAVYNQANMTLIILDNSTTAMTGHQPHPGTGKTLMGDVVNMIDPVRILEAIGVTEVVKVNPLDLEQSVETVKRVSALPGVKAIIFKYPCIALSKPTMHCEIDADSCVDCRTCINEIGCPALVIRDGAVDIDTALCTGCGLCSQVCPMGCISLA